MQYHKHVLELTIVAESNLDSLKIIRDAKNRLMEDRRIEAIKG